MGNPEADNQVSEPKDTDLLQSQNCFHDHITVFFKNFILIIWSLFSSVVSKHKITFISNLYLQANVSENNFLILNI